MPNMSLNSLRFSGVLRDSHQKPVNTRPSVYRASVIPSAEDETEATWATRTTGVERSDRRGLANDLSSATRPTGRWHFSYSAMAGLAVEHG